MRMRVGYKASPFPTHSTMECISSGILTQSSRTEIIQTLATLMWVHTHYPSKEAYNTLCAKLVKTHPNLADDAGDGQATYVSDSIMLLYMFNCYFLYSFLGSKS